MNMNILVSCKCNITYISVPLNEKRSLKDPKTYVLSERYAGVLGNLICSLNFPYHYHHLIRYSSFLMSSHITSTSWRFDRFSQTSRIGTTQCEKSLNNLQSFSCVLLRYVYVWDMYLYVYVWDMYLIYIWDMYM